MLLLGLALGQSALAAVVGKATFVRGLMTAQATTGEARIVGSGEAFGEADVLRTGSRSFAILKLNDESKITLRPNSVFKVEKFLNKQKKASNESVFLRLFKGGLRVVTGLVGKRNPKGYRLASAFATIGIRGTDFEARLCAEDCKQEAKKVRRTKTTASRVVARIAFMSGKLTVAGRTGSTRNMLLGGSLFEGDVLETAPRSVAVIVFLDESRVTLRADSKLRIDEYAYNREKPAQSNAFMRFLRGGIRVVSGLIAKARPRNYRLQTPVATIAVRGTGFELKCLEECTAAGKTSRLQAPALPTRLFNLLIPPAKAQPPAGLSAWVFLGSIEMKLPGGGVFTVNQGQAAFYNGINPPKLFPTVPLYFKGLTQPKSDPTVVKSTVTAPTQTQQIEEGLYVRVIEGDVIVTNDETQDTTLAGAGDVLFTNPLTKQVLRVVGQPKLIITPPPTLFDEGGGGPPLIDLLDSGDGTPSTMECTVP